MTQGDISIQRQPATAPGCCRPASASLIARLTGSVNVGDSGIAGNVCSLRLGDRSGGGCSSGSALGIVFEGRVSPSPGCPGTLSYLQFVSTCREKERASGARVIMASNGFEIDASDPYCSRLTSRVAGPGPVTFMASDSPSTGAEIGTDAMAAVQEDFLTYLMWQADGCTNRVPLYVVRWGWSGKAVRNPAAASPCATAYTLWNPQVRLEPSSAAPVLPSSHTIFDTGVAAFVPGTCNRKEAVSPRASRAGESSVGGSFP